MSTVAMSGSDTITLDNRLYADFADGDVATLEFPNDLANLKTGKNNNTIYSFAASGEQVDFTMKVIRGSPDDRFLNGRLAQQRLNPAGFVLMNGEFVKKIGDGAGNVRSDTYILAGGIFTKIPSAKSNTDADSDQSTTTYTMRFSNAPRAIT